MENKNKVPQDLEGLVNQLVAISDKKPKDAKDVKGDIIIKLQEIERNLLCNYHLEINGFKVFPLLVEAYYNSECFNDQYTHGSPRQRNRPGEVYIHEKGYGGIDLCLSHGEYALSFLIKNSLVCIPQRIHKSHYEAFFTQTQLYEFLKNDNNCGFDQNRDSKTNGLYYTLKSEANIVANNEFNKQDDLCFLQRKGLETAKNIKKGTYKDKEHYCCLLAAFSIDNMKKYPLTIEKGKEFAVAHYLFQNNKEATDDNISRCLGYRSKSVMTMIEELQSKKEKES